MRGGGVVVGSPPRFGPEGGKRGGRGPGLVTPRGAAPAAAPGPATVKDRGSLRGLRCSRQSVGPRGTVRAAAGGQGSVGGTECLSEGDRTGAGRRAPAETRTRREGRLFRPRAGMADGLPSVRGRKRGGGPANQTAETRSPPPTPPAGLPSGAGRGEFPLRAPRSETRSADLPWALPSAEPGSTAGGATLPVEVEASRARRAGVAEKGVVRQAHAEERSDVSSSSAKEKPAGPRSGRPDARGRPPHAEGRTRRRRKGGGGSSGPRRRAEDGPGARAGRGAPN